MSEIKTEPGVCSSAIYSAPSSSNIAETAITTKPSFVFISHLLSDKPLRRPSRHTIHPIPHSILVEIAAENPPGEEWYSEEF